MLFPEDEAQAMAAARRAGSELPAQDCTDLATAAADAMVTAGMGSE